MNIHCVICQDFFIPSAEIVTVICGHLFHSACIYEWIERSKSCPQCRQKISPKTTHRVYFNISRTEDENIDVATLQNKLDSYSFEIRANKKEIATLKENNSSLQNANSGLRQLVSDLEAKIRKLESTLLALKDQIKYLKEQSNKLENASKEIVKLQEELESLQRIKQIMLSTKDDISQILHGYQDTKGLATMIVMLKKELFEQNHKREKLRKRLTNIEVELKEKTSELNLLNSQSKNNLNVNENFASLEAENEQLKSKLQELEKSFIEDTIILDKQLNKNIPKTNNGGIGSRKYTLRKSRNLEMTESPSIEEKVKSITDSKSPYLQIKSSIVGIDSHQLKSACINRDMSSTEKCSIFKKKCPVNNKLTELKPSSTCTGMGGFAKIEEFPTRKVVSNRFSTKRPMSAPSQKKSKIQKVIKPVSSFGKLDDFFDLTNV